MWVAVLETEQDLLHTYANGLPTETHPQTLDYGFRKYFLASTLTLLLIVKLLDLLSCKINREH